MNKAIMGCVVLWCCTLTVIGAPRMRRGSAPRPPMWDDLAAEKLCVKEIETIRERLDRLYSLTNESSALSKEAQKVFRARIDIAEADYADATNELARIQVKLTPERRAELEASKRTREELKKLNAEIDAFENNVETKRRNELERERTAREQALKEAREKATEAERVKRESEAAKQKIERDAEAAKQRAEREAQQKREEAEREELARKRAAAREELAGWPMPFSPRSFCKVSVYGTNVDEVVLRCCEDGRISINSGSLSCPESTTCVELTSICSKACNVVFPAVTQEDASNQVWEANGGACLIEPCGIFASRRPMGYNPNATEIWKKYDASGRLIKWGNRAKFEEYAWITNQHAVISAKLREEWAKKHGLTLEKAEAHAKELIEVINTPLPRPQNGFQGNASGGSVGNLRARRAQRRAEEQARMEAFNQQMKKSEAALEKRRQEDAARREEEHQRQEEQQREEQRKQLLQIQEELRKARMEKESAGQ